MSNFFAKAFSLLFHPLLMPVYGLFLLFHSDNYYSLFIQPKVQVLLYIITLVFTFLLPVINAFILYKSGYIRSLHMDTKEERRLPYLITGILYFAEYYILSGAAVPGLIKILILGAILSILFAFLINLRWKISAHMIGIGGLTGAFLAMAFTLDLMYEVILLFLIAGMVGYSRLKLEKHTPSQVYAGFLLGFICNAGLLYFIFQKK